MLTIRNEFRSTVPHRKAVFQIDDSSKFEGFKTENYWNGWECPSFTKEVAEAILREFCVNGTTYRYDEKVDAYYVQFEGQPEEEMDEFTGGNIVVDGKAIHVYNIGAFGWCWHEVKEGKYVG